MPSLLVYTEAQDYIPNEHQGEQISSQLVSSPAHRPIGYNLDLWLWFVTETVMETISAAVEPQLI